MSHPYRLIDEDQIATPALVFYADFIRRNIARVIEQAGTPERLRPHAKTHKTREITAMQLAAGVKKHKCATIAEAEMLAAAGVPDVLIAYQLVGPNPRRLAALARKYPNTKFSALIDHDAGADMLAAAARDVPGGLGFLVDLDVGQHRTGIAVSQAAALYERASQLKGLRPEGLHAYDGHNKEASHAEREAMARACLAPVLKLRDELQARGIAVPRIVAGGTPPFPIYAKMNDVAGLECSPGTYVLHDYTYGSSYSDMPGVTPAAVFLTRVVSRPTATRVTFDLGSKAIAPDLALTNRVHLLDLPDAKVVGQNEEHLIVETADAARWRPGDLAYAIPGHVCPSVALHREALVAENGRIVDRWPIVARDRFLSV